MASHPLTGMQLEEPNPLPLKIMAQFPEEREKICTDHSVAFTGRIPCTGILRCHICLTKWNPDNGKVIRNVAN